MQDAADMKRREFITLLGGAAPTKSLKKIALSVPTGCYGDTFAARRHHGFG